MSGVKLTNFFLFNSNWGPREGQEEEKILYYWPLDTDANSKCRSVGLVEAVIRFGETFSKDPAESLRNLKSRVVWRQVEPDFYLVLTVTVPSVRKEGKEGEQQVEWRPEEVSDTVLLSVLQRAYDMFQLFQGGLGALEVSAGRVEVREQVSHFYSRYLGTLGVEAAGLLEEWGGLHYLPLTSQPFLRVQTLVTRTQASLPSIHSCLFLQAGQLVWSGLQPQATRLLVHYLTTSLLPSLPSLPAPSPTAHHQGRFLVGGRDTALPTVHLEGRSFHLVVYHAINSTILLLLSSPPTPLLYSDLDTMLGPPLSDLSADLTLQWSGAREPAQAQDQVRFLYYNAANFAVKATVEAGSGGLVSLAADLASDLGSGGGEVTAKLATDQWVVVRVAGVRTVIVLLQQRNLNLMEVTEEVARLDKTSFGSVCML